MVVTNVGLDENEDENCIISFTIGDNQQYR